MPLEGHARRLVTPLTGRDKLVVAVVAFGILLAVAGGVWAAVTRHAKPIPADCVVVTVPGTMGGTTIRNCGAAGRRYCLAQYKLNDQIAAECRKHGYVP